MAPADVVGVLVVGVLAVVQKERGPVRELVSRDPLWGVALEVRTEGRLVVRQVAERRVALVDPIAERRPAVRDRCRSHGRGPDLPLAVGGHLEIERFPIGVQHQVEAQPFGKFRAERQAVRAIAPVRLA